MSAATREDVDVVIHVADGAVYHGLDYATRIEERLAAAGLTSARCDLTKPFRGEDEREDGQSAKAHILTGGATSVTSGKHWMRSAVGAARRLIARAGRGECSVIGICLGSQILAEALRPGSTVSSESIEVGLATVRRVTREGIEQVVPSFHYESISPDISSVPGASIEWANDHTPVQAFSYGEHTFGCQFHPELTVTDIHNLIDYHRAVITQQHGDTTAAHRSVERHGAELSDDLFRRTVLDRIPG